MNIPCLCKLHLVGLTNAASKPTGYHDHVLGGKYFILTGDPGQLPPVGDKPLYHPQPSNLIAEQGGTKHIECLTK